MKQKITRFTDVILFCVLLTFSGCTNEEIMTDESTMAKELRISEAKSWFADYKAREVFHPIFTDINYHWEDASITVLEDGSKAVTVPITDQNLNPDYKGEKVLYLYPFEEGYYAVVYELNPDLNLTSKGDGFQNLDFYNGFISTWDLKKGFIKAQKFANSNATEGVAFKVVSEKDIKLLKLYPKAIELETVIIEGSRAGGGIDLPYSYITSLLGGSISVGGSNTDNYFNPPHGGGSNSNSSSVIKKVTIEDNIVDVELTSCLKSIFLRLRNAKNSDIANILEKLGASTLYNVTIKMGSTGNGPDYAQTKKISTNNYEITFDPDKYSDATKLFRAQALLHEIIHAYFRSVVDDYNKYPTNAPFVNFPTLYENYVSHTSPKGSDADHIAMANRYVNAIASALQEYDANYTVPYEVYTDLVWGGLRDTSVYNKKESADKQRIEDRYRAEQNGAYSNGQKAIGKPCM